MKTNLHIKTVFTLSLLLSITACAGAFNGKDQAIIIDTSPRMDASCVVTNENGAWNVEDTPSHIDIDRAKGALSVTCRTLDGWRGHWSASSQLDPAAVAGTLGSAAIAGGALAAAEPGVGALAIAGAATSGGIASASIDAYYGAAFRYPTGIVVPMTYQGPPVINDAIVTPPAQILVVMPIIHRVAPHRHIVRHTTCRCGS
jgi:hypothetical protein